MNKSDLLIDAQGWDDYWTKKNHGGFLYDFIAAFYRKVIIRPNLNRVVRKYIPRGGSLLHAGCGSGQVDRDIRFYAKITGLDISRRALEIYRSTNEGHCKILHGSILSVPLEAEAIDGIYNLGVMEHFSRKEILSILTEFRRLLGPAGKLILFWPPEYGLTVQFFKLLTRIIKLFSGKTVHFHPAEVSRLKSRTQAEEILHEGGFRVLEYSFGYRDLWTYSVIVAEKE